MKPIFDFTDYRLYLLETIAHQPNQGRGFRSKLAEAISSPVSHISQVLNETSHFSLEQGEQVNVFLGHSSVESEYFLLLIQYGRAGTDALKKRFQEQMDRMKQSQFVLKNRLEVKKSISPMDHATFYSHWYYVAVHIFLTIPKFQTKEALAKRLGLPLARVSELLQFMESIGVVTQERGRFIPTESRFHLGTDSPLLAKHHANWRIQTLRVLEQEAPDENLHYSSVVSISEDDVKQIKSIMIKNIEQVKSVIKTSDPQDAHCFSLDFYRLKN